VNLYFCGARHIKRERERERERGRCRDRGRDRDSVNVIECERERLCVFVCVIDRVKQIDKRMVYVCMGVRVGERECVFV
jgi:hypothetical protein